MLCSLSAFGQAGVAIDSLLQKLSSLPDTSKTLLYEDLALRVMNTDPTSAMNYGKKGLALAQTINYPLGEARNINRIGTILRANGRYADALTNYFAALSISEKLDDKVGIAKIYNSIGILYAEQNESERAIEYYQKAKKIAKEIDNKRLVQIFLLNIGTDYAFLNQLDSAAYYTQKAYTLAKSTKANNVNVLLMNLGNINYRQNNFSEALKYYHQSIPLSIKRHDNRMLSQTYFEMARLFKDTNQADSAVYYAQNALNFANESNNLRYKYQTNSLLSDIYSSTNTKKAFTYYKESVTLRDSLFNIEKATNLRNIEFNEEMRQQELKDAKEESRTNQKLGLLLGLSIGLLLTAFVLYRNNIQKSRANASLAQKNEDIEEQRSKLEQSLRQLKITQNQLLQSEKLASLGELTAGIAHEIQNPLNFVTNFSETSLEIIEELEELISKDEVTEEDKIIFKETLAEVKVSQNSILNHGQRASSIVTGMLEHSRGHTGEQREIDINKLCDEYTRLSFHGMRAKNKSFNAAFTLELEPDLPTFFGVAQDISRVLLNLINNAFYTVNKKRETQIEGYIPTVTIKTKAIKDEYLEIAVSDNGNGMTEEVKQKIFQPFFTTKPTGEGTGLGLSLSYDIITKGNNGTMEVETELNHGSTFTIKLPITKK